MIFGILNDAGGFVKSAVCVWPCDTSQNSADLLVFGLCSCKMAWGTSAWMFVMFRSVGLSMKRVFSRALKLFFLFSVLLYV